MRIDLDHLRVFYEVAKAGSFTAAAEILHISQPAISRTISLLEGSIGTPLFTRHARGVALNVAGEHLVEFAADTVEKAKAFEQFLQDRSPIPRGKLRILTTPHIGSTWLMQYIPDFLKEYPDMRLKVVGKQDDIEPGNADALIRTHIPDHSGLIQIPLRSFSMGLFASSEYIEEFGMPQTPEDLDHHRLITFEDKIGSPYRKSNWILSLGAKTGVRRQPYYQVNSIEGDVNAAKVDLGIAELLEDLPIVKNSGLVRVLPEYKSPPVHLHYIYPEHMKHSKRISSFGEYLSEALATERNNIDDNRYET